MSSSSDYELITGQLHVTNAKTKPEALGRGQKTIRGASYMQGPTQVGNDGSYSSVEATVMVGPLSNGDIRTPTSRVDRSSTRPTSMKVIGNTIIDGDVYVSGYVDCLSSGRLEARHQIADARPKPFDMVHPSKGENYRLRYACIEGPEVGIYFRGRLRNQTEIELPWYWKDLVHIESITVQLQPIGSHQDIIVKRWDESKIYLQSQGGMPIDCFYHIYAERKDVNALVVEYNGTTWEDYPDPDYNDPQYSNKVNTKTI
jgi:hypothetical protein